MIFGTRKLCFARLPTYFKFTFMCYNIPHQYVLLVFTFDAVFSHLYLTNACKVNTVNTNQFADLPYLFCWRR